MSVNIDSIVNGFTTLGFPIMACLGIGYYCYNLTKRMMEVIETNTRAMTELTAEVRDKMGDMDRWLAIVNVVLSRDGTVTTDYPKQTPMSTPIQTPQQQVWKR